MILISRLHFEETAQAQDAFAQLQARATNTGIVGLGTPSESTSYALLLDNDGAVQDGFHIDTFAIVREGEWTPPPNNYPVWIQPTGAQDSYPATNAAAAVTRVEHDGHEWENTHGDGNSWEPGGPGIGETIWADLGEVGA